MTSRSVRNLGAFLRRIKIRLWHSMPCGDDHSLRRKLLIGTGIALVCTGILATSVIGRSLDDYRRARQNLRGLEGYRLILDAANLLSAERGPSNSVLGDAGLTDGTLRERLVVFRSRSDAILEQLSASGGVPSHLLTPVKAQLRAGRREVDRVAAMPRANRSIADVQAAIESMFQVVDTFQSVVAWKVAALSLSSPGLAAPVMTGRILGELREHGGRIASQIMAPIAVSQPLQLKHLVDSNRTRGRILELWRLIGDQDVISRGNPLLSAGWRDVEIGVVSGK